MVFQNRFDHGPGTMVQIRVKNKKPRNLVAETSEPAIIFVGNNTTQFGSKKHANKNLEPLAADSTFFVFKKTHRPWARKNVSY